MATVPLGHTHFSWRGSKAGSYLPVGHTKFSWVDYGSKSKNNHQSEKCTAGTRGQGGMRKFQLYSEYPMLNKNISFGENESIIDRESLVVDARPTEPTTQSTGGKKDLYKTTVATGLSEQKRAAATVKQEAGAQKLKTDAEKKPTIPDQARIERKLKELSCKSDNGIGVSHLLVEGEKNPVVDSDLPKVAGKMKPADSSGPAASTAQPSRSSSKHIVDEGAHEPAPPKSGGCCTIA